MPQELALYEDLSARENLAYWGAAYGMGGDALQATRARSARAARPRRSREGAGQAIQRRHEAPAQLRLRHRAPAESAAARRADGRRRSAEPRAPARARARGSRRRRTCVLYTTHYMEEAQDLCDRLAIIDHGKLLAMGTLDELRRLIGETDLVRLTGRFDPRRGPASARRTSTASRSSRADERALRLAVEGASRRLPAIFSAVAAPAARCRKRRSASRASRACSSSSPAGSCGSSDAVRPDRRAEGHPAPARRSGGARRCGSGCRSSLGGLMSLLSSGGGPALKAHLLVVDRRQDVVSGLVRRPAGRDSSPRCSRSRSVNADDGTQEDRRRRCERAADDPEGISGRRAERAPRDAARSSPIPRSASCPRIIEEGAEDAGRGGVLRAAAVRRAAAADRRHDASAQRGPPTTTVAVDQPRDQSAAARAADDARCRRS